MTDVGAGWICIAVAAACLGCGSAEMPGVFEQHDIETSSATYGTVSVSTWQPSAQVDAPRLILGLDDLSDFIVPALVRNDFDDVVLVNVPAPSARDRDFIAPTTPAYPSSCSDCRADAFVDLLEEDLVPWAEETFGASATERVMLGSSFGGHAVVYTLTTRPELFSTYLALSPSLHMNDAVLFWYEGQLAESEREVDAHFYTSVTGEEVTINGYWGPFVDQLQDHDYEGLRVSMERLHGYSHESGLFKQVSRAVEAIR